MDDRLHEALGVGLDEAVALELGLAEVVMDDEMLRVADADADGVTSALLETLDDDVGDAVVLGETDLEGDGRAEGW